MKKNFAFYSLFIFISSICFTIFFCSKIFASDNALISMIQEYDYNSDFSNRLVVETDKDLECESAIAVVRENNIYYLQYPNEEETKKAYEYYSSLSYVDAVAYDIKMKDNSLINNEFYFFSWGAEKIGADTYNEYLLSNIGEDKTNEIIVAVLDSGIDTDHPWFVNRIESGGVNYSSTYDSSSSFSYEDDRGHGTHASGIIVDLTLANVKILPIKVLNNQGAGDTTSVLKGIDYVIDLKKQGKNIVAMNMSFGVDGIAPGSYWHQKYTSALEEAYELGILSIVAAGNGVTTYNGNVGIDASNTLPANVTKSITIAAVQESGDTVTRSVYSNYGKVIDYAAPGTYINSAVVGGGVDEKSGTSMAAPHVTAAIALLKSDSIMNYSNSEVERILKEKVIDLGDLDFDNYYGNGMINIDGVGIEKIDDVNFSETNINHITPFLLELTSTEPGTVIYYTLDGSDPTLDNGFLYTSKINISSSTTVKAKAYVLTNGHISKCSNIKSYSYVFSYSISVTVSGNGSANILGETWYLEGMSKTIFFYPDEGNYISELKIDNRILSSAQIENALLNGYEFNKISSNHTVEVKYAKKIYTITSSSEGNGYISPSGYTYIESGLSQEYQFVFGYGNYVEKLFIDGTEQSSDIIQNAIENGYAFNNVTRDHTIHVVYKTIKHNIIVYKEGLTNGVLTETLIVDYGTNKNYFFERHDGYNITQIKVNGTILSDTEMSNAIDYGYVFYNVQSEQILYIKYETATYTITSSSYGMARITPNGIYNFTYNSSQKYVFSAISGYCISEILIDGVPLEAEELQYSIVNGYTFDNIKSDHTIQVFAKLITYDINVNVIGNGLVTPSGSILEYKEGTTKTLRFTPSSGWYVEKIIIDDDELQGSDFDDVLANGYTFENICSDHNVQVVFNIYTFTILATTNRLGYITPNGNTTVKYGESQIYSFSASPGYHIKEVIVDNEKVDNISGTSGSYTFEKVKKNHTIIVNYEINKYTITSSAEGGGSITPLGEKELNHGESQVYNLIVVDGYYVDKIIVDHYSLNKNKIEEVLINGYTFSNVISNHYIEVYYKIKTFEVTKQLEGVGIVNLENDGKVNYGENIKFTIEESEGYVLDKVYIDNELVESKYEYTFKNIKENHFVKVVFVELFEFDIVSEVGGLITTDKKTTKGEDVTYYFTPKEGYYIKNVYIDGKECGVLGDYTFYNIDKKHSIEVIYQIKVYQIIIRTYGNGYATSTQNLKKVEYGSDVIINLRPEENYEVGYVLVNEKNIETVNERVHLENVVTNLEVAVMFKEKSDSSMLLYVVIGLGSLALSIIFLKFIKLKRR